MSTISVGSSDLALLVGKPTFYSNGILLTIQKDLNHPVTVTLNWTECVQGKYFGAFPEISCLTSNVYPPLRLRIAEIGYGSSQSFKWCLW